MPCAMLEHKMSRGLAGAALQHVAEESLRLGDTLELKVYVLRT